MQNLNKRVSQLEQQIIPEEQPCVMIVRFIVRAGGREELARLRSYDNDFICERDEDETEEEFLKRAKEEALEIKPPRACAILLIDDNRE